MAGRSDTASSGRYVQGGGVEAFPTRIGWWERKIMTAAVSDVPFIITSKYHKRPDLLAFDVYGSSTMMWLVLQFNNIVDINEEFIDGKEIMLPLKSRVYAELTQRQEPLVLPS